MLPNLAWKKQGQSTIWLESCRYVSQQIHVNVIVSCVWSCRIVEGIYLSWVQVTEVVISRRCGLYNEDLFQHLRTL